MPGTDQLTALADPTRRSIVELLRGSPASVRELTDQLDVSQPAVSHHLKVLREASLARCTARGASNLYSLDRAGFVEVRRYLDDLWDDVLDAFVEATADAGGEDST